MLNAYVKNFRFDIQYTLRVYSKCDILYNCNYRIAVCILGPKSYCYNSNHLIGFSLVKKRHLEIMNYKFVEVIYCYLLFYLCIVTYEIVFVHLLIHFSEILKIKY